MYTSEYVHIIILRHEEMESYLNGCQSHDNIDILVLNEGALKTNWDSTLFCQEARRVDHIRTELKVHLHFE